MSAPLTRVIIFLQFDSGREDQNWILIFATNEGLNDMKTYKNGSFDDTFNNSPNIFYQLFTIHIQIGKITIPRIFAFLPNKSEVIYQKVFCKVEELVKLYHVSIMCDFEKAAINAIMRTYPDTCVSGCFFHFCQSSYRKIVSSGYKNQ